MAGRRLVTSVYTSPQMDGRTGGGGGERGKKGKKTEGDGRN